MPDLRGHGATAGRLGFPPPHDLAAAGEDLVELLKSEHVRTGYPLDFIAGHSLGGKVTLEALAQMRTNTNTSGKGPGKLPKQVWVLDSIPGLVEKDLSARGVDRVLSTLATLPTTFKTRGELALALEKHNFSPEISAWLGSSLTQVMVGGHARLRFEFDVSAGASMYGSYCRGEYWDVLRQVPPESDVHIVRGLHSDRWDEGAVSRLQEVTKSSRENPDTGNVHVHELSAGHWVHTDNPQGLHKIMKGKLRELAHYSHG